MKKIFILDDNEELLEIMQRLLRKDFDVHCSCDTENVVPEIMEYKPDVLILDHSIGDINSAEILEKLRTANRAFAAPVILFSAHPNLAGVAALVGAHGYIDKPSDISYIREYIKQVMQVQLPAAY